MELSKEKINQLIVKYSSMGESKANWLSEVNDYEDKVVLVGLFEEINQRFSKLTRFENNVHGIAYCLIRKLYMKFKKDYSISSFLSVLNKYKYDFDDDNVELLDNLLLKMDSEIELKISV